MLEKTLEVILTISAIDKILGIIFTIISAIIIFIVIIKNFRKKS